MESSTLIERLWCWLQQQPRTYRLWLLLSVYLPFGIALELLADYYRSAFQIQPWDPASGLYIVLLFGFGLRYIPAVFLVTCIENLLWSSTGEPTTASGIAGGIAGGIYLCLGYGTAAALLLYKLDIDPRLRRLRDVLWFSGIFAIAALIMSSAHILTLTLLNQMNGSEWLQNTMNDWAGEATGVMVLAPPLLILLRALPWSGKHLTLDAPAPKLSFNFPKKREALECVVLIATAALFTWLAFGGIYAKSLEYSYFIFIPLVWTAARHGFEKTTSITLIINILAVVFVGAYASVDPLALQFGLMTMTFTGVLLGACVTDRKATITQRRSLESQLKYDATHDNLTGLYNRTWLWTKLAQAIEQTKADENYLFALLFVDLDRFKDINDSLGHSVGDHLLIAVGKRLSDLFSQNSTIARFGGDEFVVLLYGLTNLQEMTQVVQRLCDTLSVAYRIDGYELFTTVSVGVSPSCLKYEQPEDLLRDADIAMYEAKRRGKSQFVVFDRQMYEQVAERSQLEKDLRRAVQDLDNG